jgi:hypothetical protein
MNFFFFLGEDLENDRLSEFKSMIVIFLAVLFCIDYKLIGDNFIYDKQKHYNYRNLQQIYNNCTFVNFILSDELFYKPNYISYGHVLKVFNCVFSNITYVEGCTCGLFEISGSADAKWEMEVRLVLIYGNGLIFRIAHFLMFVDEIVWVLFFFKMMTLSMEG